MRISIVGTGYVGLSTGVGFAKKGNDVTCVDIVKGKVGKINSGESPIYEPFMEEYLREVVGNGKLKATMELLPAVSDTDITFISVPTPQSEDGSADLSYIERAARDIGRALKGKGGFHVVVVKSTVVPGTTEGTVIPALEEGSGKKAGTDFGVCMNPEFLREGRALEDFLKPDRVVIGSLDERGGDVIAGLYDNFDAPILRTDLKTAEMIKYAANSLLATKISFANEVGNICKRMGIDTYDVMKGVGMDSRISPSFLDSGAGFGGSCFPKDVAAIVAKGKELGCEPRILSNVIKVNREQRSIVAGLLEERAGGLEGKKVAVLGLAFKPESDDIREAPSIDIIRELKGKGARISAYDPQAMENMRELHPDISYEDDAASCINDADACLILTEWNDFKALSDTDFSRMKGNVIIEARKVLDPEKVKGFEGVCWPGNLGVEA
ncbi:MAG: UDP-glucose 6-dehydrogenase [Candidatus Aenigmatarchaeota archaeon]|nr:MAG: UDP-glucose 6-dehydrogenase [Candidatus Aenigmarchaeota archaeon]